MVKIIYDDAYITVCEKLPGMISEASDSSESLIKILNEQLNCAVYPLHRLDKPVGGAIMYAKSKEAASVFSRTIAENKLIKTYIAVLDGIPREISGELHDLLFRDSRKNKTYVVKRIRKGVKEASLKYDVIDKTENNSLVLAELITGRSHQIRAQFASRKTPVTGDGKYGSKCNKCTAALWSYSLKFVHPFTEEKIIIKSDPPYSDFPWNLFGAR